ncbi:MAG: hypothetical protein ABJM43_24050 [Paracoccaceae bacterium]|uniref:hypothetical protein n=1 Tax=Shimia thalassica TaxID=1715693 RepID=UPI00329997CA
MKFYFSACFLTAIVPFSVAAEIPRPVRSMDALLNAENIILCSDFEELSASRVSLYLRELAKDVATAKVLDGPTTLVKSPNFNVLAVISGINVQDTTKECALATVPYGRHVIDEIDTTVQRLLDGFEYPDPTINDALGDTQWASSNFYYETENWITVVIAMRTSSAYQLDYTMMSLFGQPEASCEQNLACLSR